MRDINEKIYGCIFGQAIGDALGLASEFLSKQQVRDYYPQGLKSYQDIVRDRHRKRWAIGSWTDDTDQMLCIFDSLLESKTVDILDIARRLYQWAENGGMGIGRTVYSVLYSKDFLDNPHQAAKIIWERSGQQAAANGGIMRTSILGVWQYQNQDLVKQNTEVVCKITHYDPRCIGSCIAITLAISALLQGEEDIKEIFNIITRNVKDYDAEIIEYLKIAQKGKLEDFKLDEGLNPDEPDRIGYTLKAMGAALWTLKHAECFDKGLLAVIYEGGDADTNAAVAGSVLGARFGFSNIFEHWIENLLFKEKLYNYVNKLLKINFS